MNPEPHMPDFRIDDDDQLIVPVEFHFGLNRRAFVQWIGAGLLITAAPWPSLAQQSGRQRGGARGSSSPAGRIQIGTDGVVTVMTGKVEVGQGARAEITQAAAEELRVPPESVRVVMADTGRTPDDGITAGSRTTPSTIPAIRQAAAIARDVLVLLAARRWGVEPGSIEVQAGKVVHPSTQRTASFGELAAGENLGEAFQGATGSGASLTTTGEFKTLGTSVPRPNAPDIVTGAHEYPSDIQRPGMLYGKVLRPPSYGAELVSIDLEPDGPMAGVKVLRDGEFVGACAGSAFLAQEALRKIAATAEWKSPPHPSSSELFDHLRGHVREGNLENPFASAVDEADRRLRQSYRIAYVQHAPMETRAAVAEWTDGSLTVWTGTQNPFGVRRELARALRLDEEKVRVIVPDTGGGFGGKHTGETAIEAARLSLAAGKPVSLKWTREEEFTWAYYRPAAVVDIEAGLDANGRLTSWYFVNINGGRSGVPSPYRCEKDRSRDVGTEGPLRQGSYRALGSTGSNFARECFMDELAELAGMDPLEFRLAHLEISGSPARIAAVLKEAARRFNWNERFRERRRDFGVGLACGTEKGSHVAACVEVEVDRRRNTILVRKVCEAFECGTVYNPDNLRAQVEGAIIMGLGPALREEMRFADGKMQNPRFSQYAVPRFSDLPDLDISLVNRPDLAAVGGGETPIIAIAPAIANAVFHATGTRVRSMPIRLSGA